eukprot:ANDGO_01419.mRNA.1 hypothetical protein (macronuclear)
MSVVKCNLDKIRFSGDCIAGFIALSTEPSTGRKLRSVVLVPPACTFPPHDFRFELPNPPEEEDTHPSTDSLFLKFEFHAVPLLESNEPVSAVNSAIDIDDRYEDEEVAAAEYGLGKNTEDTSTSSVASTSTSTANETPHSAKTVSPMSLRSAKVLATAKAAVSEGFQSVELEGVGILELSLLVLNVPKSRDANAVNMPGVNAHDIGTERGADGSIEGDGTGTGTGTGDMASDDSGAGQANGGVGGPDASTSEIPSDSNLVDASSPPPASPTNEDPEVKTLAALRQQISDDMAQLRQTSSEAKSSSPRRGVEEMVKNMLDEMDYKQQVIEKFMSDFDDRLISAKKLEAENGELRKKEKSLDELRDEFFKLRDRLSNLQNLDGLDSMPPEELARKVIFLSRELTSARNENAALKAENKVLTKDMKSKRSLEKKFRELQQAHVQQAELVVEYQESRNKVKTYKDTIQKQEQVIEKLESLMKKSVGEIDRLRKKPAVEERDVQVGHGIVSVASDEENRHLASAEREKMASRASAVSPDSENKARKMKAGHELDSSAESTAPTAPTVDTEPFETRILELEIQSEEYRDRCVALEEEMEHSSKRFAKELASLRMQLMQAQGLRSAPPSRPVSRPGSAQAAVALSDNALSLPLSEIPESGRKAAARHSSGAVRKPSPRGHLDPIDST